MYVFSTVVYVADNVHPQNTMQMVRALSEAQILFKSNVNFFTILIVEFELCSSSIYKREAYFHKFDFFSKRTEFFPLQFYVDQNHLMPDANQYRHLFISMNDFMLNRCWNLGVKV